MPCRAVLCTLAVVLVPAVPTRALALSDEIFNVTPNIINDFAFGWFWHLFHTQTYHPATQGAFTSLDFAADFRRQSSSTNQGTITYVAIDLQHSRACHRDADPSQRRDPSY